MTAFVEHTEHDRKRMLEAIGVTSFEELIGDVPAGLRLPGLLPIDEGLSETETLARAQELARLNQEAVDLVCFAGGGIYDVCVPAATKAIASRPEYATSYTPYQAEVSQGSLQATYEFQTIVTRLTGMDLANASMYDGGSALAEAVLLARATCPGDRILVSPHLNPSHREILVTMLAPSGARIEELPAAGARTEVSGIVPEDLAGVSAVVLQHPNYLGALEDMRLAGTLLEGENTPLFIASVDLSSLAILDCPGAYGADIAVGEAQTLGIPMSFGGPVAGVIAARQKYLRRMPGRIVGMGRASKGQRAFTLTLQTREQHIRRARATSNICTNQALVALMATVTTALLGETGRRLAATLSAEKAAVLAQNLSEIPGIALADPEAPFFREFALRLPDGMTGEDVVRRMRGIGILAGIPLERIPGGGNGLLVAVSEKRLWSEIEKYVEAFREIMASDVVETGAG
jgi:glycine dehydrogenase subunit 1